MNFWTYMDRNSGGFFFIALIALCFYFGTCGDAKNRTGCQVRCGTGEVNIGPVDAGADQ